MSLLTTLAYAITAAVRPMVRDAEVAALKAQVDDLRRELPHVERQRDDWRALAMDYREALLQRPAPSQQALQALQALQTSAMTQQALQTSVMARQAYQSAMQNGPYIGQIQHGMQMQNFGQQLEEYVRNCTPGRHELLTRS